MKSLNNIHLIGHLGADPECKESDKSMVVKFGLATSEDWIDKATNEKKSATDWHNIVCFNQLAEIANRGWQTGFCKC